MEDNITQGRWPEIKDALVQFNLRLCSQQDDLRAIAERIILAQRFVASPMARHSLKLIAHDTGLLAGRLEPLRAYTLLELKRLNGGAQWQ